MGTSLSGLLPQDTYQGLIKVGDNTAITSTLKTLSDGAGNNLPMQASSTGINFTGTTSGLVSGVSGAIQFSNGSAFASDAANLFWDDTNNRLGIGTNAPTATTHIRGVDQLSTSTSLLVTDSIGGQILRIHNQANNSAVVMTTAKIANYEIVSGDVLYNTSMRFVPTSTGLAINKDYSTSAASTLVHIKGSGSTSATTSLLVQNSAGSTALTIKDDRSTSIFASSQFCLSNDGSNTSQGTLRFLLLSSSGNAYIDGWSDGTSKGQNYPIVIGSRVQNVGSAITGNTTTENGTPVIFGYEVAQASALVTINSTTRGFLPPRMTTTQKNAIATPTAGLVVYDSTMNATCEYTGTAWRVVSAGAQAVNVTGLLQTVSLADGNVVNITLNSSTTFTLTNPALGTYILKLTQGTGGGFLVIWPGTVIWSGGTAPTLTTTAGKVDIITLVYDGTNYYGNYSLNY
jgi:hypothetical protein